MAKYYYDKYTAEHPYYWWEGITQTLSYGANTATGYTNWRTHGTIGYDGLVIDEWYEEYGDLITISVNSPGTVYIVVSEHQLCCITINADGTKQEVYREIQKRYDTTTWIKGTFIETIQAENGTYPDNGYNSADGYWYVKTKLAEKVTIIAPNGGEVIAGAYTIQFTITNSALPTEISISVNNGQSWTIIGKTQAGATSFNYDFSNIAESAQCLVRARMFDNTYYGDYDQSDGVFTIQHNLAPTAPTNLSPASTVIDRTKVQRFSWKHNDTDAQSKFDLQYSTDGGSTWTTVTQNTTDQYWDASANIFPAGSIYWKVRTYDSQGLVSPYSTQATFTAADPSNAPIILGPTSPVAIARPVIQWSQADQTDYQINIFDSLNNLVWDSGDVVSTNRQATCGIDLLNGGTYTIKVRTKNAAGLWTDWAAVTVTISYTPPAIPTVEAVIDNTRCSVTINITHPVPTGTQPTVSYSEILRSKLNENNFIRIATNVIDTFTDYTVQPGQIYEYRAKDIGDNGTSSLSDVVQGFANIRYAQLSLVSDPSQYIELKYNADRSEKLGRIGTVKYYQGREYPVTIFSTQKSGVMDFSYRIEDEDIDMFRRIAMSGETLLYRDNRGRKIYCTIPSEPTIKDDIMFGGYDVSFSIVQVDYTEAV